MRELIKIFTHTYLWNAGGEECIKAPRSNITTEFNYFMTQVLWEIETEAQSLSLRHFLLFFINEGHINKDVLIRIAILALANWLKF